MPLDRAIMGRTGLVGGGDEARVPADNMAPQTPISELSFKLRDVYVNATILESLVNGIYTAIVVGTIFSLLTRGRLHAVQKPILLVMFLMYIFSTIHLAQRWQLYMLHQPQWSIMLGSTMLSVNTLLADFVLIWRCWKVWGRDWRVIVLPVCSTLVGIAFCIISLFAQSKPGAQLATHRNAFVHSAVIFFSLSLATTLLVTISVLYRVFSLKRGRSGQWKDRFYNEAIVESALLYSLNLIIFLPFLVRDDFNDAYPQAILAQTTGIAPTLIIARIALGICRPDAMWPSTNKSSLAGLDQAGLESSHPGRIFENEFKNADSQSDVDEKV
ncbi:hypothetical protein OF83DRAFT_1120947 [Amylostereum chailletii]|nr:hypothetical protein OF83DRAFT_1120947 [Amylostereum chailletii]